jgi:hypothetical protein
MVDAQFGAYINGVEWQRVAERNQFIRTLGGLYASKARHSKQVPFGKRVVRDAFCERGRDSYAGFGHGAALRDGFRADINHGSATVRIKVR